jgi:hypothetical protein
LHLTPVKENQEIEVSIDNIGSRGAAREENGLESEFEVWVKNPPSRKSLSRLKG